MTRSALVTGVTGQDGVLLARLLRGHGMRVVGTVPPGSGADDAYLVYLDGVELVEHDVSDTDGFRALLRTHLPHEVYNLASLSSVGHSWDQPDLVAEVNGGAVERMVAALVAQRAEDGREIRLFQASSSEELGEAADSPYAKAKRRARDAVARARDEHGLYACSGILHNHESPLRGRGFVTRKITRAAAEIALGRRDQVSLGNLEVSRDWGAARDYVEAMRLMLRQDAPADLPLGTGVGHTLHDLLRTAFTAAGIDDPSAHVIQDPALLRPTDARAMVADPEPAAVALGWRATTAFEDVIEEMVDVDLERLRSGVEESPEYLQR